MKNFLISCALVPCLCGLFYLFYAVPIIGYICGGIVLFFCVALMIFGIISSLERKLD